MTAPSLDVFQVIADPSRRKIMQLLAKESMTINALAENFDMSRPAVSKHIRIMHEAGFLSIRDIGRERHCILQKDGFDELQRFIDSFDKFWDSKLKKLELLLNARAHKS